jgi:hypothetical protein
MNKNNIINNQIWLDEDVRIRDLEKLYKIPDASLKNVPSVIIRSIKSLNELVDGGGCYWIWTNEPIIHSMHKHRTPEKFNGGEIIYNGIAGENLKGRIISHLFAKEDQGWSGMSVDLLMNNNDLSHRKKAMSKSKKGKKKVPYINGKPINDIDSLLQINLSKEEKNFIKNNKVANILFRNGINVCDPKHSGFRYKVYFIQGLTALTYFQYIEKKWRDLYGLPKLCSYSSGR